MAKNGGITKKTNGISKIMSDSMKNTLSDLNNYLFEQMERLQDDSLDEEALDKEIKRSEAVQKVAKTIIENGKLALSAKKHLDEYGQGDRVELPMLGMTSK